jgi:hypothetical protein
VIRGGLVAREERHRRQGGALLGGYKNPRNPPDTETENVGRLLMLDAIYLGPRCPNCWRRQQTAYCRYCNIISNKDTNMTINERKNLIKNRASKEEVRQRVADHGHAGNPGPRTPTTKVAQGPAPSKKQSKAHRAALQDMHAQSNLDADEVTEQVEHDEAHAKRQALADAQKAHEVRQDTPSATKPKAAKEKAVVDANVLSVSDVAREQGVDPKAARAKLRKVRGKAEDGRWAKVQRDSKEHAELIAIITADKDEE